MPQLIAVVTTAVFVNGERTTIKPGDPLPELSEHDARALKGSGAALDPQLDAEAREVVNAAALNAAASFQTERARVQAEAASIESPAAIDPSASGGESVATTTVADKRSKKS